MGNSVSEVKEAGFLEPDGVPTTLPGVELNPETLEPSYMLPLIRTAIAFENNQKRLAYKEDNEEALRHLTLVHNYMMGHFRCFTDQIDCYFGNRLMTYLLTIHPTLSVQFPEYQNPLDKEPFSAQDPVMYKYISSRSLSYPVLFSGVDISLKKIITLLHGLKDLNKYLKTFPPLNPNDYPTGYHLYRGKQYEGEFEKLTVNQTFKLPKLTSTSITPEVAAAFGPSLKTRYIQENGNLVEEKTLFLWRIKVPLGVPFPFISAGLQKEVLLPIGTQLRYLGCHIQYKGENSISSTTDALLCEFEVVGIGENDILLATLIRQLTEDFEDESKFNIIMNKKDMISESNPLNDDLPTFPLKEDEVFGGKRKRKSVRKKKAKSKHLSKKRKPKTIGP